MPYVAANYMLRDRAESLEREHTRELMHAIVLSEWAELALMCFLRVAHEGRLFFTKCPDPRLLSRRNEPTGERSVLFRLSAGLVALIRSVGVAEIHESTEFDAE